MILLFDGNNLIYRSYFAVAPLTTKDGTPTNALFGAMKSFRATIQEFRPEAVLVCWDSGKKTFRHEQDENYKANRDPIQDNLKLQFPIVQEAFRMLGVPQMTADGVESDDLIGTIAHRASVRGLKVTIVSSDKDFYQLVNENITVYSNTVKKKDGNGLVDVKYVTDNFGVLPNQLVDVKSMTGEKTDNIIGVKGIGPKIATRLVQEHGTVFNVIKFLHNNTSIPERHKPILSHIDVISNAYQLAKIRIDVDLTDVPLIPVDQIEANPALGEFFKEYEMRQFQGETVSWMNLFNYKHTIQFK